MAVSKFAWICVLACSCAGGPEFQDPVAALTLAEDHLDRGEPAEALELLESLGEDVFDGDRRERYLLAWSTALFRNGHAWDAFEIIRDFADDYPHSNYSDPIQDLQFEIGATLIRSDGGFLWFASDRDDGQAVLEHFTVRWPHPAAPDALRLLGGKAFDEGDYELAKERFRDLLLNHENSEWVPLARFRMAMAWFLSLEGPAYDLRSLQRTHEELRAFLSLGIENQAFTTEAAAALAQTREWLGTKHELIADFYTTVGNRSGAERHRRVIREIYPETEAGLRLGDAAGDTPEEES